MYRMSTAPARNSVSINGMLLSYDIRDGKSKKNGNQYRMANAVFRVNQFYSGKEELSEVPVKSLAMKFKKDGTDNKFYATLGDYAVNLKSAARYGTDEADKLTITGRNGNGALSENMFASERNPETVYSTFNIDFKFLNEARYNSDGNTGECATFDVEIFILDIARELNAAGEETGRLKIRGGIVQWGEKIDCFDFFVENPTAIEYIERNYNINDTASFVGRIRYTSETVVYKSENTWGETIPTTSTRKKHELIITGPSAGHEDGPNAEEDSYDPEDIRTMIADRNARKEDAKNEARKRAKNGTGSNGNAGTAAAKPKYGCED